MADTHVSGAASGPRVMRVLAAEDNSTSRLILGKLLRPARVQLCFAMDGAEAVARFRAAPFDLVFMDICMPGVDGKEATRRIRGIEAARGLAPVTIVAITALTAARDRCAVLAAGVDHFLAKPLQGPLVLQHLAAACPPDCLPVVPDRIGPARAAG